MSSPQQAAPEASSAEDLAALRSDFLSALGWMALGIAILIGSIMTDPIRIAIPKAIQPSADRKSLRKAARSSAAEGACSREDIGRA